MYGKDLRRRPGERPGGQSGPGVGEADGDVVEGLDAEQVDDDDVHLLGLLGVVAQPAYERRLAVPPGRSEEDEPAAGGAVGDGGEHVGPPDDVVGRRRAGDDEGRALDAHHAAPSRIRSMRCEA